MKNSNEQIEANSGQVNPETKITEKDVTRMSVNMGALGCEFSWNYPRQGNIAYASMMDPLLKKIYKNDPEGYRNALVRHMEFFNITPQLAPFVGAISATMEEKVRDGELPPESVNSVKSALMGPLSGIGDSIFLGCIRIIALGVGLSLAAQGNILGPILYVLIYNIPAFLCRIFGAKLGYRVGAEYLNQAQKSGIMSKVMFAAGILGVMTVGAMTPGMFWAGLTVTLGTGESAVALQEVLDGILPGMLALGFTWLYYYLLGKKISPTLLIFLTMLFGIVCAFFGIMAA